MGKTQQVRMLDVLLVGPFMVWFASTAKGPEWARLTMAALGILTILYNGANYLRLEAANGA